MKKDYIEREAVLAKGIHIDGYFSNMISAYDVEDIPSSEDVVEVVRCRDCRHAWQSDHAFDWDGETPLCECGYHEGVNRWHEYCSWGEKRKQPIEKCLTCNKSLRGRCLYRECSYEPNEDV